MNQFANTVTEHQHAWSIWLKEAFPNDPIVRPKVRVVRFLEEAIELAQAMEVSADEAHELVDYVFGRPVGEPHQELAGSFATLLMVGNALGMDCGDESLRELDSAYRRIPEIREKAKLKPKVLQ